VLGATEVAVLEQNVTQELAREVAGLLNIADASDVRSLHRLAVLASRQVAACSGATAALWRDGDLVEMAATHPDLADLFELSWQARTGPWVQALATGGAISCPDSLAEERWPAYATAALCRGVRCSVTLVHQSGPMAVTLSLFGARPRSLDPERIALAELLIAFGGATLGNASIYTDSRRTALQLREAAESRTIVDQAKGILMHTFGCSAEEAFDRMRGVSQTRHIKVTEVARTIIKAHRSGSGPRPKDTSRPADASGPGNASRPADTSRLADALQPAEHGAAGPAGQAAAGAVRGSDPS
jgi:ANTAR domain-containing protein